MSDPLEVLLSRMDCQNAVFTGEETAAWPQALRRPLRRSGLLETGSSAKWIECDGCGDRPVCKVIWITSPPGSRPRAYFSCPECGRVRVHRRQLHGCRIDLGRFVRATALALQVSGTMTEVVPLRLWRLGVLTSGKRQCEVFLVRGLAWSDGAPLLGRLPVSSATVVPLVLVVDPMPPRAAISAGAPPLVAISEVVSLRGSTLAARISLEELLRTAIAQTSTPAVATSEMGDDATLTPKDLVDFFEKVNFRNAHHRKWSEGAIRQRATRAAKGQVAKDGRQRRLDEALVLSKVDGRSEFRIGPLRLVLEEIAAASASSKRVLNELMSRFMATRDNIPD